MQYYLFVLLVVAITNFSFFHSVNAQSNNVANNSFEYDDGQTENLLSNFTNSTTPAQIHSTSLLSSDILVAAGTITYPANFISHPNITDDTTLISLQSLRSRRTSSFLVIFNTTGNTIMHAVRTVICSTTARFSVIANEENDTIFLVGSTLGAYNASVNSSTNAWKGGPVIITYSISTYQRQNISVHEPAAGITSTYDYGILLQNKTLLALGYCSTFVSPVFSNLTNGPTIGGICASILYDGLSDITNPILLPITLSTDGLEVSSDKLFDVSYSDKSNESTIFLSARRTAIVNSFVKLLYIILSFDIIFPITNSSSFSINTISITLPDELQVRVPITSVTENIITSCYIARENNSEALVSRRFVKQRDSMTLEPLEWNFTRYFGGLQTNYGTFWRWRLDEKNIDNQFTRSIQSTANAACKSPGGQSTALILSTANLFDSYVWNADLVVQLTNGRIAAVVMNSTTGKVMWVSQSWKTDWWQPETCRFLDEDNIIVAGIDKGQVGANGYGTNRGLIVKVRKPESPIPESPLPLQTPAESSAPTPTNLRNGTGNGVCIGSSSIIKGEKFTDVVEKDQRMRLQRHVYRKWLNRNKADDWNKEEMLCVNWSNQSRLCATHHHVVKWNQQTMYMKDFCDIGESKCEIQLDEIVNFKGVCGGYGDEIDLGDGLSVTMHAGSDGVAARTVIERECMLQTWSWPIWWFSTL